MVRRTGSAVFFKSESSENKCLVHFHVLGTLYVLAFVETAKGGNKPVKLDQALVQNISGCSSRNKNNVCCFTTRVQSARGNSTNKTKTSNDDDTCD